MMGLKKKDGADKDKPLCCRNQSSKSKSWQLLMDVARIKSCETMAMMGLLRRHFLKQMTGNKMRGN